LWLRRGEIVPTRLGELEELGVHDHADGVDAYVAGTRVAAAVTEEARERVHTAGLQFATEDVACHGRCLSRG
jgi:hypothetical protein